MCLSSIPLKKHPHRKWRSLHVPFLCIFSFCFSEVDDVDDLMADIQEQMEKANEISQAISEPTGYGLDLDEVSTRNTFMCMYGYQ